MVVELIMVGEGWIGLMGEGGCDRGVPMRSENELAILALELRAALASRNAAALILEVGLDGREILMMEVGRE